MPHGYCGRCRYGSASWCNRHMKNVGMWDGCNNFKARERRE